MTSTSRSEARRWFQDIDGEQDDERQRLLRFLELQNEARDMQRGKLALLDYLNLQPGNSALDAGSGLGYDAVRLAEKVGPSGRAVGLDVSEFMLDEARRRFGDPGLPIEWVRGDVQDLPFDDATFDGVRCERVVQHLSDPLQGVAELIRVTKPGGRIGIFDSVQTTSVMSYGEPEIEQRLNRFIQELPGGTHVLNVPAMFDQHGLTDIRISHHFVMASGDEMKRLSAIQDGAIPAIHTAWQRGVITDAEYEHFMESAERTIAAGIAFQGGLLLLVAGTKPTATTNMR